MEKTIFSEEYIALIDLFRRRRIQRGLRQRDVAGKLGWDRQTLSKIELRDRRLDVLEAFVLAKLLGLNFRHIEGVLRRAKKES